MCRRSAIGARPGNESTKQPAQITWSGAITHLKSNHTERHFEERLRVIGTSLSVVLASCSVP